MIAIIDYGLGNLGSILNIIKRIGHNDVALVKDAQKLREADKYILPGVGAFDTGMQMLTESGMRDELEYQVMENHKPILGICLGMQMLGKGSEEGTLPGLGFIPFVCKQFNFENADLRVPHMGWDFVSVSQDRDIVAEPKDNLRFYFVHSYYAVCENESDVLFTCDYGGDFAAGVSRDNVYGVQFHPEKSHGFGKWLMKNYVEKVGS